MTHHKTDTVVIGAGIAGIATAYYLAVQDSSRDIIIVDPLQAMSFTSAHSGENYRNWWSLDWTDEELELLAEDPKTAWLAEPVHGGIHCRPDGGERGSWIKLGWAYNHDSSNAL